MKRLFALLSVSFLLSEPISVTAESAPHSGTPIYEAVWPDILLENQVVNTPCQTDENCWFSYRCSTLEIPAVPAVTSAGVKQIFSAPSMETHGFKALLAKQHKSQVNRCRQTSARSPGEPLTCFSMTITRGKMSWARSSAVLLPEKIDFRWIYTARIIIIAQDRSKTLNPLLPLAVPAVPPSYEANRLNPALPLAVPAVAHLSEISLNPALPLAVPAVTS